jgi:hypothetical protein
MKRFLLAGLLAAGLTLTALSEQRAAAFGYSATHSLTICCQTVGFGWSFNCDCNGPCCNSYCFHDCGCPCPPGYGYGYGGGYDGGYAYGGGYGGGYAYAAPAYGAAPAYAAAPAAPAGFQQAGYTYPAAYGYGYAAAPAYWYGR